MKKQIQNDKDYMNTSPVNWYVAHLLVRFEFYDEDKSNQNRRCLTWKNEYLIRANSPNEAYNKAIKLGKLEQNEGWILDGKRKGKWHFEGLTSLLPIYEELEDGAEISWTKYENKAVRTIKGWVKQKKIWKFFKKIN
jgi:hypothetical protein